MATPRDHERTAAFRRWIEHVGGIEAAQIATGIAPRSLQRMSAGKVPPPARLLDELAEGADQAGATELGRALRDAARPATEKPDA